GLAAVIADGTGVWSAFCLLLESGVNEFFGGVEMF
ncbi:hypothetical protein PSYJA_46756, partial [Pseudomonas syringae pv. japonica str. M301072]